MCVCVCVCLWACVLGNSLLALLCKMSTSLMLLTQQSESTANALSGSGARTVGSLWMISQKDYVHIWPSSKWSSCHCGATWGRCFTALKVDHECVQVERWSNHHNHLIKCSVTLYSPKFLKAFRQKAFLMASLSHVCVAAAASPKEVDLEQTILTNQ